MENLYILTWNICWGCMSSDKTSKNDRTAKALAEYCFKKKEETEKNVCLDNVSSVINNKPYDIIALQETMHWKILYENLRIENKCYINLSIENKFKIGVNITTFYNNFKFELIKVFFGIINDDLGDVRPFQFILFKNRNTSEFFYFINLHNAHSTEKETVERKINLCKLCIIPHEENIDIIIPYSIESESALQNNYDQNLNGKIITKYRDETRETEVQITEKKIYPIIMAGDFNDHGKFNYWHGLEINSTVVSTGIKPPNTCCTPNSRTDKLRDETYNIDDKLGDYILTSDDISVIKNNSLVILEQYYNSYNFPTSDHLPVEALVSLNDFTSIPKHKSRKTSVGGKSKKYRNKNKRRSTRRRR